MKLEKISALEVLDSNSKPTIKITLESGNKKASATVPGGTSKGIHEKKTISNEDALELIHKLKNKLKGQELDNIDEIIDSLPGNVSTGLSIASIKLIAELKNKPVYELMGGQTLPVPFLNVINGGLHAGNKLSFQEFMIAPLGRSFKESIMMGCETYHALKDYLRRKYGPSAINVGMEGGFAPPMKNVEEALKAIKNVLSRLGYIEEIKIGLDCAMNENYFNGKYEINNELITRDKLMKYYEQLTNEYDLVSIEDPFNQEDFESFSELTKRLKGKTQIVGDDLLATNPERVAKAIDNKSCNCLLLKINQVGTVSKATESASLAVKNDWRVMVSHRSGDSCDSFIADYSVGINAGQIKSGAPARGERVSKYNRLIEIEQELSRKALYPRKII